MKKKHVPFLFICLLMFPIVVIRVESAEPPAVFQGFFDNMYWDVRAPHEVKIGEEFSVIFRFRPITTLDIEEINVKVEGQYGSGIEWEYSWKNMLMQADAEYTKTAYFTAAKYTKVWWGINAVYDEYGERHVKYVQGSYIGEIHSKTYSEYVGDYSSLNQSYLALQTNYESLETNLKNTQMLVFPLMITTVVFIITTVYFAVRKPKVKVT